MRYHNFFFCVIITLVTLINKNDDVTAVTTSYQTLKQKQQQQKEKLKQNHDEFRRQTELEKERKEFEKHQRRRANGDIVFYDPPDLKQPEVSPIVDNDSLLFVGHRNVIYGSLYPYGFIKLMEQKLQEKGLKNITLRSLGTTSDNTHLLDSDFLSNYYLREMSTSNTRIIPSKAIILLGNEVFDPLVVDHEGGALMVKRTIERIVATFVRERIPTVLSTLFVSGEKYDNSNPYDSFFEEWQSILNRISTTYENVTYVDFSQSMQKYWESRNVDNVDHSILTHDGEVFNKEGHAFIACQLLQLFKILEKPFIDDVSAVDLIEHSDLLAVSTELGVDKGNTRRAIYHSPLWDKLVDDELMRQRRKDMEEVYLQK